MKRNKQMDNLKNLIFKFVLTVFAILLFPAVTFAGVSMPALTEGETGTLTIHLDYNPDETAVQEISGAEFSLYKIATLTVSDGKAVYTPIAAYRNVSVDYNEMSASDSRDAADALKKLAVNDSPVQSAVTDDDGNAVFSGLEPGMYLTVQTGSDGRAGAFEKVSPFLVSVPMAEQPESGEGEGSWNYVITAEPKTEPHPHSDLPTPTPTPSPTATPVPTSTPVPTATPIPTATPVPTQTPTEVPELTVTPEPTGTPEVSVTPVPSDTPVPSEKPETSVTPSPGVSVTDVPKASVTPSVTVTSFVTGPAAPTVTMSSSSSGGSSSGGYSTAKDSGTTQKTATKTGDDSPTGLWICVLLLTVIMIGIVLANRKKSGRRNCE